MQWVDGSYGRNRRVCESSGNNGGEDEIRVRYRRHWCPVGLISRAVAMIDRYDNVASS